MATTLTKQNFTMHSGDDKTLQFTVKDQDGVVVDITGASITWAFAARVGATAIASKTVGSGITITDAAAGVFQVTIDAADTASLTGGVLYHEAQLVDSGGVKSTIAYGDMTILPDNIA